MQLRPLFSEFICLQPKWIAAGTTTTTNHLLASQYIKNWHFAKIISSQIDSSCALLIVVNFKHITVVCRYICGAREVQGIHLGLIVHYFCFFSHSFTFHQFCCPLNLSLMKYQIWCSSPINCLCCTHFTTKKERFVVSFARPERQTKSKRQKVFFFFLASKIYARTKKWLKAR